MFQINPLTGINLQDVIWTETKAATIFKKTGKVYVQPLLQIPRMDAHNLTNLLSNMAVPESGWYVCLQNREGGYNPSSESTHAFRNSTVQKFVPAIEYIVENDGYVIQMGESTVTLFPQLRVFSTTQGVITNLSLTISFWRPTADFGGRIIRSPRDVVGPRHPNCHS